MGEVRNTWSNWPASVRESFKERTGLIFWKQLERRVSAQPCSEEICLSVRRCQSRAASGLFSVDKIQLPLRAAMPAPHEGSFAQIGM